MRAESEALDSENQQRADTVASVIASPASAAGYMEKIREVAAQVAEREGCALYEAEMVGAGANRVLRIYIEKAAADAGGASIDDCSNVSRGLNLLLDVEDVIPGGAYSLEVSTPGLERVLRAPWHYERAIGKTISVKSFAALLDFNADQPALGKARQLTGLLAAVVPDGVRVQRAGSGAQGEAVSTVFIPYASITKANVVFQFEEASARPKDAHASRQKQKNKKEKPKR